MCASPRARAEKCDELSGVSRAACWPPCARPRRFLSQHDEPVARRARLHARVTSTPHPFAQGANKARVRDDVSGFHQLRRALIQLDENNAAADGRHLLAPAAPHRPILLLVGGPQMLPRCSAHLCRELRRSRLIHSLALSLFCPCIRRSHTTRRLGFSSRTLHTLAEPGVLSPLSPPPPARPRRPEAAR